MDCLDVIGLFFDRDEEEEEILQKARAARRKWRRLLLLLAARKRRRKQTFREKLNMEGRRRRNRNLVRASLLDPNASAWRKCYNARHDGSLITITGFDHATFQFLYEKFLPLYDKYTPWCSKHGGVDGLQCRLLKEEKRGKKWMVSALDCLGLTLAWYRFRGAEFVLQGWFGFTGSQCNVWLRFGRRMLLKALIDHPYSKVDFPDKETIVELQRAVLDRHEHLHGVYCFADGLKLPFEACSGLLKQGMCHNCWTHGHYITNVLVFSADGRIIDAALNVPGSVHDSQIAPWGGTYRKLKQVHEETGGICCVDSAFASANVPYLIRSSDNVSKAKSAFDRIRMTQATSLRQAAEWGMRAMQGAFPRLKDHIPFEETGERAVMLKLVPLLCNLRATRVGLNQIRNTYMPHLSRDASFLIKRND